MASQNAAAIAVLCSHLCVTEGIHPLEPREWSQLAQQMLAQKIQPAEVLAYGKDDLNRCFGMDDEQAERIFRLVDRTSSLTFEIAKYEAMGIRLVTRADAEYPLLLKKKLGNTCPPLFYCAGDPALLKQAGVGYVGSRTVSPEDVEFTRNTVSKTVAQGYLVVSGGARGVDSAAEETALSMGGGAVAYLADSMMKKIKKAATAEAIRNGRLLLLSVSRPDAGFNVGMAMMRNRFIYAQAEAAVVIKSDLNKGGTWSGAVDDLKHGWCPLLCRDKKSLPGNQALLAQGAIPVDEQWNGDASALPQGKPEEESTGTQISLFGSGK